MANVSVLVADKDQKFAESIKRNLNNSNYAVLDPVSDISECSAILLSKQPEIFILSLNFADVAELKAMLLAARSSFNPMLFVKIDKQAEKTMDLARTLNPHGLLMAGLSAGALNLQLDLALQQRKMVLDFLKEYQVAPEPSFGLSPDSFFVRHKSRYQKLEAKYINFVEALKDYVVIHTDDHRYTIHSTMKDLERKLPKSKFVRIHRSYIVQRDKIMNLDYSELQLAGVERSIPIGGSYRDELHNQLQFL